MTKQRLDLLERRVADHDGRLATDRRDIDMLQKILESQQQIFESQQQIFESQQENNKFTAEIAGYAKEMLAVVCPLMRVVRVGGIVAKYVSYMVISFTAAWHATKYVMVKIMTWHI